MVPKTVIQMRFHAENQEEEKVTSKSQYCVVVEKELDEVSRGCGLNPAGATS